MCNGLSNLNNLIPPTEYHGKPIRIVINEVIECGHFWCSIDDEMHVNTLNTIQTILNNKNSETNRETGSNAIGSIRSFDPNEIRVDVLCMAQFRDEKTGTVDKYRARILAIDKRSHEVEIIYVDYGNKERKKFDQIYKCSEQLHEIPFQAVECKLANINPSLFRNPNGVWVKDATKKFKEIICKL